jgi:hypothetical protein
MLLPKMELKINQRLKTYGIAVFPNGGNLPNLVTLVEREGRLLLNVDCHG